MVAEVEGIEKGHELADDFLVLGDDAGLEVTSVVTLGTEACTGEIGGADVGDATIGDDALHVHARAEDATEEIALDEFGEAVEVGAKAWAGFLGVDETHFDTFADFSSEHFQDLMAPFNVGQIQGYSSVEAAWTKERSVEDVGTVRGGHHNDPLFRIKSIHFNENLVERLLSLIVAAAYSGAAHASHRIDFVDEDDRG